MQFIAFHVAYKAAKTNLLTMTSLCKIYILNSKVRQWTVETASWMKGEKTNERSSCTAHLFVFLLHCYVGVLFLTFYAEGM